MSHADVLNALQAVCPPVKNRPETGVSLVARFKRDDLGLAELGTFVFTTDWHLVMATAMLALLPPALVVVSMQKWFVKGLVDTEK